MSRRGQSGHHRPIDVVYLWVDGADPRWQAKRRRAFEAWRIKHPAELAAYGNVAGRFRDNGELRFNLRALEHFFPDHGHVYVVTDAQVPDWLDTMPGITVVDHRDLIPRASLPVFDSGHIESYVHHIPGLAERYFYLNDDIFFGASVDPEQWFGEQLTVAMETSPIAQSADLHPTGAALVNASILSARWLASVCPGYVHEWRLFSHSPRAFLRSAMYELERQASELFRDLRSTRFRSWRVPPIVSDLAMRWMVQTGAARSITLDPLYISTGDDAAEVQFSELRSRFGALPFFCINDTCDDASGSDHRLLRAASVLEDLLPRPSRFERRSAHASSQSAAWCGALAT
ncbi:exopolysaccharide phosphotransferase [Rhizobacter sp. Root1221]|nr:exopolysaccharide phosphotransferase [Rhizobacter sp. Root1221]